MREVVRVATASNGNRIMGGLLVVQNATGIVASTMTFLTAILTATRTNTGGLWRTERASSTAVLNSKEPLADDHERAQGNLLSPGSQVRILLAAPQFRSQSGRYSQDEVRLDSVMDGSTLLECRAAVETVTVAAEMVSYITAVVRAPREKPKVQVGSSPRGSLSLLKLARARAALSGRDFVVPEDVQDLAVASRAHRLNLSPELWALRIRPADIVTECVQAVPVPPTLPTAMMSGTVDRH